MVDRLRRFAHLDARRVRRLRAGDRYREVEHVLATQCIVLKKPRNLEARITGSRAPGVSAKDLILH